MDSSFTAFVKADGSCPYCDKALALLAAKAVPHKRIECQSFEHLTQTMWHLYGTQPVSATYPQIIELRNGTARLVGGYDKLCDALDEPILEDNPLRFTLFPIQYPDLYDMYQKALASFWTPQEVSLAEDVSDWTAKLSDDDRYFIKHVLSFFAGSDGIVMENLAGNFAREVQIPEARQFYASQMLIEAIHSEQYALLIDTLATPDEALGLFQAIESNNAVRKKAAWAQKYLDPTRRFAERLVAFVCVEGILFSGSFCAIYWLKRRGVMPGLCLSNEFISRDEALHYNFGVQLYRHLRHPLPEDIAKQIVTEAIETELEFVVDAIPCRLVGMNAELMQQYIKFVADRALTDLGYGKMYNAVNPFPWMELIGLTSKTNFFERLPSDYQRAGVMASSEQQTFGIDEDF
jgi:ribonucleotide reductase beta subunit family protein with ferritin-like domain/glutaredoxin